MNRLLLLANTTGYQAQAFAEAARRLGLAVAFGTDRCHVLDDPWQDAALALRFEDPAGSALEIVQYARENPVGAIVAVGDAPAVTAAHACRALGLPGHPPEAAEAGHNKFLARRRLRDAGLNVPAFARVPLAGSANKSDDPPVPFPCVIKPLALAAGRGVIRADNPREYAAAFARVAALLASPEIRVKKEAATDHVLVEQYIPGCEFAAEGLMHRGRLRVLAIFDKPDPLEGPYFEETIYVTPPRLPEASRAALLDCLERAVRALGFFHGPLHAEFRWNERGAWPLEVAARPIGGLCARVLRFHHGLSLEDLVVRNALGESLDDFEREDDAAGVMMIPVPQAGVYCGVEGVEEALAVPGISEVRITAKPGQALVPWPEGASYPGFLFARGASSEFVEQALRQAHQRLRFLVSPKLL